MSKKGITSWFACLLATLLPVGVLAQSSHWAFKPASLPLVPSAKRSQVANPIDAFIVNRLQANGLTPSPQAARGTLIRRVTFDLTGLPPTPAEIAAFLADKRPDAYERLVERLLASPRFGERWAQHWLDVVRFAESNGYEHDLDRDQAWRYRDWVVAAFSSDKPYDQFIREQVAGDLIAPNDFDSRVATGFLRCGPFHITGGNLDKQEMRQEWLTEAVAGIGNGILGLTIGCARCHDHKYDPITQAEYYRLQAFFAATDNDDTPTVTDADKKRFDEQTKTVKDRIKPIEAEIAKLEQPYRDKIRAEKMKKLAPEYAAALAVPMAKRTPEQKRLASEAGSQLGIMWDEVVDVLSPADKERRAGLRKQIFELERQLPAPLRAPTGVAESIKPKPAMHLLVRGDVHRPGLEVTAGYPRCVAHESTWQTSPAAQATPAGQSTPAAAGGHSERSEASALNRHSERSEESAFSGSRLELANWLASAENPLSARVIVNRLWSYLFGKGLVATPNDFGRNGKRPTHPELLDWMAVTLTTTDHWHLRTMIRRIVTSNTYRQSSALNKSDAARDPDNRLLWRMNRKRLDAEEVRDSVLAAAGTLNPQMGGPSVRVPLEPEVYDTIFSESEPDNLWPPTPDAKQHTRRSLYLFRKRNVRLPMLTVFDQPDMMSSCAARGQTVHALQALNLLNSDFMQAQSLALTQRLFRDHPTSEPARINELFTLTLGRAPSADELAAATRFLARQADTIPSAKGAHSVAFLAQCDLCLAVLNLNELVYLG